MSPRRGGVGPAPVGPGRARSARQSRGAALARAGSVRCSPPPARPRSSAARPVSVRPAPRPLAARSATRPGGARSVALLLLVAFAAAAVVAGLGLLGSAVRAGRVPEATTVVRVAPAESIWQVARRVAPSADPGDVAARIVELNQLGSPSVRAGQQLVSPTG
ncbi:LysM peptidoglycan-binding domain-containing protein [Pseudonocardia sp.]|uniref:LysM peptidoglycan-binding domain-containing protein n=1 Tax=Pseudonocardia sp. TaxID=60912 RepID=UPI002F3E7673